MRSEVSVPGIRNERGKLPDWTGAPGGGAERNAAERLIARRLRQLVEAILEELLIGPQIRQLVGAGAGQPAHHHKGRRAQPQHDGANTTPHHYPPPVDPNH